MTEIPLSGSWCTPPLFLKAVNNGETPQGGKVVWTDSQRGEAETLLMSQGGAIKQHAVGEGKRDRVLEQKAA